MLSTRNKYIITAILALLVLASLWVSFAKGTLVVNTTMPITNVLIDGRKQDVIDGKNINLSTGFYKVVAKYDYYESYQGTVLIGLWTTKTISITPVPTAEGKSIIDLARAAAKIETTF
jgi:hypothetical protein